MIFDDFFVSGPGTQRQEGRSSGDAKIGRQKMPGLRLAHMYHMYIFDYIIYILYHIIYYIYICTFCKFEHFFGPISSKRHL